MSESDGSTRAVRKDIEGLRAVAVLAVVVNHTYSSVLRGGFVGVDVFFVISGYLIGMHLLQDIQKGQLSFLRFYGLRARRLLPALIAMLLAVWCAGWILFSSTEFADLGKQIAAAALFSNNVLLSTQIGYFDPPSSTKPLLHLWSLGVEEQFYLLVPFLIWLSSTGRRESIRWVLRLSIVSLMLTVIDPAASFYLLDTRFWELGAGVAIGFFAIHKWHNPKKGLRLLGKAHLLEFIVFAMLVMLSTSFVFSQRIQPLSRTTLAADGGLLFLFAMAFALALAAISIRVAKEGDQISAKLRSQSVQRDIAAIVGIVLIGTSLVVLDSTDWPGPQTVWPVLGTMLVVLAGQSSRVNQMLAWRPLSAIGGISYPLYLWHWPALVVWRLLDFDRSAASRVIPVVCAFLLAWLTQALIENPARFGRMGALAVPRPPPYTWIAGLSIIGAIGASTILTGGYPRRIDPILGALTEQPLPYRDADDWRTNPCFFRSGSPAELQSSCTPPKRSGTPRILLWGDSHAAHLYPGLLSVRSKYDFTLVQRISGMCPPVRVSLVGEMSYCASQRDELFRNMDEISPDIAVLSGAWEAYLEQGSSEAAILAAIDDSVLALVRSGIHRVVLFGPGPTWVTSAPGDLFRVMLRKGLTQIPKRIGAISTSALELDAAMAARAKETHIEYVSVVARFCDYHGCLVSGDRAAQQPDLYFRDQGHLTPSGSRFLIEAAAPQIFESP